MSEQTSFNTALTRILRPLIRMAIARSVGFPAFAALVKQGYLQVAERCYSLDNKRLTDSRISLLTGLQRKDIKALRADPDMPARRPGSAGVARVMAHWQAQFGGQHPRPLPLTAPSGPSFEALVAQVSRDVHHRTVLDELVRQGLAELDGEVVTLTKTAFVPDPGNSALVGYWGDNIGDHAEASTHNVVSSADASAFYDRAVHYNRLSQASIDALQAEAQTRMQTVLADLNQMALNLQQGDVEAPDADQRIRIGGYVYAAREDT